MQVFSKQLSGLGNQLFQYAAGLHFAHRYKGQLTVLQEPVIGLLSHGKYHRPFLLSQFQIQAPTQMLGRLDSLMLAQGGRSGRVGNLLKTMRRAVARHESQAMRYRFLEDLGVPPGTRSLYIAGYWQAYQYAQAVAPQLRQHLRLRQPATGENLRVLESIQAAPVSVSVHVRRGDYTLAVEGNIALSMDYYRRAINVILERFQDPLFFIFSDDIQFARANLPQDIRRVFVEGNDDFNSHEDLRLMSSCQHHIIANSSFSWWGAWLNADPGKIVLAPKHWHLSTDSVYPHLLPPDWIALDSVRS